MISTLSFGTPLILMALIVLPAIWFLLRVTPPKPQREPFPPLKFGDHCLEPTGGESASHTTRR